MIELIIILFFTFFVVILFSQFGVIVNERDINSNGEFRWNRYYFVSFIILTLFIGTREGVGRDFYTYIENYYTEGQIFEAIESREFGYIWLSNILHFFNLDYHSFFLATSFITVLLLFNSFKNFYQLLPIGILLFFIGGMFGFVINGVRQGIAMMAFYNALRFISWDEVKKNELEKFFWFSFYIAVGALFHYSIIAFIPFYFILQKRFLSLFNPLILSIIVISGFFINANSFLANFSNSVVKLISLFKNRSDLTSNILELGGFHIGAFFILLVNLAPFLFFNKVTKESPAARLYFVLFAIGTGLMYAFSQYLLIHRIILYLSFCSIFVYPYTYFYFKRQSQQNFNYLFLNISILSFLLVKFIYSLPEFMESDILKNNFSLWFIPLIK